MGNERKCETKSAGRDTERQLLNFFTHQGRKHGR